MVNSEYDFKGNSYEIINEYLENVESDMKYGNPLALYTCILLVL